MSGAAAPAEGRAPDVWGGLAASLVTLPSALAFGVATFAAFGPSSAGLGAFAGLVGAVVVGVTAPLSNGAPRLITTPCAPAAAVMGAFAAALAASGLGLDRAVVVMSLAALLSGALQVGYGLAGGGKLIKFIPYPVVTGYLSAVGVIIFLSQLPHFIGVPGAGLGRTVLHPGAWSLPSVAVGAATIAAMTLGPRLTKRLPPAILGLLGGLAAYWLCAAFLPGLRALAGNALVIGPLPSTSSVSAATLLA
ncbi:MAG: SulP family inorganic anion transporter, partial [Elusimicrobia bacterium]|nr:SulP family inorganic anion transporter [Elusimicrobiota bacterium]